MNPQQELITYVKTCYSLLSQLEAASLKNNREIARKDELLETLRLDALSVIAAKDQIIETMRLDAEVLSNDLDDVRAAYCSLLASYSVTLGVKQDAEQIAKSFGWSCYDRGCQ